MATIRTPEKDIELSALSNVLVCKLDVIDKQSIAEALTKGLEKFGNIDVLVNNASYGTLGVLEAASDEEIKKQFEVDVYGLINVTKAVLPIMSAGQG
ncbi:MAG TPA: SDR family NAD(P)-dependent oxidoreductase [Cytophagaceae bacterium]